MIQLLQEKMLTLTSVLFRFVAILSKGKLFMDSRREKEQAKMRIKSRSPYDKIKPKVNNRSVTL